MTKKQPVASLIIRGPSTQYVPGLGKDDFVIIALWYTVYISDDVVHGTYYHNQGHCGIFHMPIDVFEQLEYIELSTLYIPSESVTAPKNNIK